MRKIAAREPRKERRVGEEGEDGERGSMVLVTELDYNYIVIVIRGNVKRG